jgi:hypothetical protein
MHHLLEAGKMLISLLSNFEMLLPSEISEKFDDVLKSSSELHNRWRQYQLHFWTTGIALQVKTVILRLYKPSPQMTASQTYYYPCPEIGLNQKNTDCKMRERARASSSRTLEGKRQFRRGSGSYSFQVRWTYISLKTCRVYYIGM